jgi:hypothetical protein
MSGEELAERLRQRFNAHEDVLRWKAGLRHRNMMRRDAVSAPHFFFAATEIGALCNLLRERLPDQVASILEQADQICAHRFDLLGYEQIDYGKEIDWHADLVHAKRAPRKPFNQVRYLDFGEVGDSKVTWELNRHQHLVTLAKAYRLSGDTKYAGELSAQWKHWHLKNPYPVGINWASSLEVAFRSLSWIWLRFLIDGSTALTDEFHREWLEALGTSGRHIERYLSTYFSPNTHLLGEAVALFLIGTLCPELESASRWRQRGWELVLQQARSQVQADGFHFEQSTYYHVYALDFFLHTRLIAARNGFAVPEAFDSTLQRMMNVLCLFGRAGIPPRFGDDDGGRVFDGRRNRAEHLLDPLAAGAVLFRRGDFKFVAGDIREETVWLLGEAGIREFDHLPVAEPSSQSVALSASGFHLMADAATSQQLVVDAGPQGAATAGHGHADALGITLNSAGRALLIDPGTFEYVGADGAREAFRGTAAHNTLTVDRQNQAEAKGPFAWTNLPTCKAEKWITGENFDLFVGSHDGYARLQHIVLHRRWIFGLKSRFWLVRDLALGSGHHRLDLNWHLSPELNVRDPKNEIFRFGKDDDQGIAIVTANDSGWTREVRSESWSPAYGRKEPAPVLNFSTVAQLPAEFVTLLVPMSAEQSAVGELVRLDVTAESHLSGGYRYHARDEEHSFAFARAGSRWSLGSWASDAEFLYLGHAPDSPYRLIFCNGSYFEVDGRRVISCKHSVSRCEIMEVAGRLDLHSSDIAAVTVHLSLNRALMEAEVSMLANSMRGSNRTDH